MGKSTLPALARAAAPWVTALLGCAAVAALVIALRLNVDVRARLRTVEDELARLSQTTRSEMGSIASELGGLSAGMDDLSVRLGELSQVTRRVGAAGRATRADVSQLRDGVSSRLDDMAQRVSDLVVERAAPEQAASVQARSPERLPEQSPVQPLALSPKGAVLVPAASPAEVDLSATRLADQAAALFRAGEYGLAQEAFSRVLARRPDDSTARLYYAASLYRANPADSTRYTQIEKNLRSALAADPGCVLALDTLSMVEVERGRWPDALDHLRQLTTQEPRNARFQKTAGFCALKVGDPAAAHDFFHAAASLSARDPEALTSLGDCEWTLGNAEDAGVSWSAALAVIDAGTPAGARAVAALRAKLARVQAEEAAP